MQCVIIPKIASHALAIKDTEEMGERVQVYLVYEYLDLCFAKKHVIQITSQQHLAGSVKCFCGLSLF